MADKRFAALSTDPRYRLPNRKESRTAVDPRFKRLFTDQDFRQKATVDRYGRKIQPGSGKEKLERLYRLDKPDSKKSRQGKIEREVEGDINEGSEDRAEEEELIEKRDPARDGGFSQSSSEGGESSSEEESDDEAVLAEETAGREQTESVPMGEVSHRLAVVNLDWDNIRAVDIMAVASSFAPKGSGIGSVAIYPSEFGRERMEREELEGPPREIFSSSNWTEGDPEEESGEDVEDEEDDEKIKRQLQRDQAGEGQEFDTAKLRQYQLDRLRYFYAVITCDSEPTAKALYDAMDTREYLTSSNFFDLRFIPNGTSFEDDQPRDECTQLPSGYKPNDFRTEALTHSKVRLTWDDDDTTRKEVQKRAFSRAEMDENDLQAYIGSDSSDAESITSRKSTAEDKKLSKKAAAKAKMRAALGLGDESTVSKKKPGKDEVVGDMQITFTSGLSSSKDGESGVFENEPQDEESTRARYIRKEKERKQKRKERMKASRGGPTDEVHADSDAETHETQDQGFDDPFFTDPSAAAAAKKKAKKLDQQKKREAQAERDIESATQKAQLDLLMADENDDNLRHFDMREIEKAQKRKNKKTKKRDRREDDEAVPKDTFQVETKDPRFKALFESHDYAIDPTNPRFKGTEGMKALLEEGRKKRKLDENGENGQDMKRADRPPSESKSDLKSLVARLRDGKKAKR